MILYVIIMFVLPAAAGGGASQIPALGYKKWGLRDQVQVSDLCSGGSLVLNPFDQMKAASLVRSTKHLRVCICVYVCMCVCARVCAHTCVRCVHVCTYVRIYNCMW